MMVALGMIPTLHAGLSVLPIALAWTAPQRWTVVWLTPVVLYLLPVLVVRLFMAIRPFTLGQVATDILDFWPGGSRRNGKSCSSGFRSSRNCSGWSRACTPSGFGSGARVSDRSSIGRLAL